MGGGGGWLVGGGGVGGGGSWGGGVFAGLLAANASWQEAEPKHQKASGQRRPHCRVLGYVGLSAFRRRRGGLCSVYAQARRSRALRQAFAVKWFRFCVYSYHQSCDLMTSSPCQPGCFFEKEPAACFSSVGSCDSQQQLAPGSAVI